MKERLKQLFWAVFPPVWGVVSLRFAITGIQSGVVENPGRFSHGAIDRAAAPGYFWFCVATWLFFGFLMLVTSLWTALPALKSLWQWIPFVRAKKKAALSEKAQEQVRNVEAGHGPEPLWVRFPGTIDSIAEAALQAYLQDVFVPFWMPLSAEARAAYLRRNPPPSSDWQQVMAGLSAMEYSPD